MMNCKKRGRPADGDKATKILDVARSLFLEKGPDVTLDEIASLAGVAKVTLYAKFSDKKNLIRAVIRRESDLTITDQQVVEFNQLPVLDALIGFGIQFVRFINSRDLLSWDRLISSLDGENGEFSRAFFDLGPGRGQALLVRVISNAIEKGELKSVDANEAADVLTGIWLGFVSLEIKLGVRPPLEDGEIVQRVKRGVSIFMEFYG